MQFTEAQQKDLMLLRRLFYGKLGVLARQRRDCLLRMPYAAAATEHEVSNRLSEVVTVAQELVDITAAERQTRLQFTSAYRRGVSNGLLCMCLPSCVVGQNPTLRIRCPLLYPATSCSFTHMPDCFSLLSSKHYASDLSLLAYPF